MPAERELVFTGAARAAALILAVVGVALIGAGCADSDDDDQAEIRLLLNGSGYTDESNTRSYGDEDSTLVGGGEQTDDPHRVPFVRFRRYIPPGGVSRTITVDIPAYPGYPDTTALATIVSDIHGELRTMYDTTTNPMLVWRKPFVDVATRTVYLTKTPDGWRIRRVSPLEFRTLDTAYDLSLVELKVHAASWAAGDTFYLTSGDTLLTKRELPCFVPEDTVEVWMVARSDGDSCWTFLHHGRRGPPRHHHRRAYLKESTFRFQHTWYIGPEGGDHPEVRPSGHDAIGWNSLWADSSEPYVSAAWGLPYIVKSPGEEIPEE